MSSSPEGLFLDKKKHLCIGPRLGSGACGEVFDVLISDKRPVPTRDDEPKQLAVKLVPYVAPTPTKKKKTAAQTNGDLLYYEYLLYVNFNSLRGSVIPLTPFATTAFGSISGYRYLLMEKMERPLFAIPSSEMAPLFGEIATTLISHVEKVHALNFLVVDIKPENVMVAFNPSPPKESNPLHSRIRIIDIGLFDKFIVATTQKHRPDLFPNGTVVGTPVYASLNVLQGHTISRRDDLEALGYMILEMMLLILHCATSASANEDIAAHELLPWSDGKSDKEIFQKKKDVMDDFIKTTVKSVSSASSSSFFDILSQNNNKTAAQAMKGYMCQVRQLAFGDQPDYEALKRIVSTITIHLPQAGFKSATAASAGEITSSIVVTTHGKRKSTPLCKENRPSNMFEIASSEESSPLLGKRQVVEKSECNIVEEAAI